MKQNIYIYIYTYIYIRVFMRIYLQCFFKLSNMIFWGCSSMKGRHFVLWYPHTSVLSCRSNGDVWVFLKTKFITGWVRRKYLSKHVCVHWKLISMTAGHFAVLIFCRNIYSIICLETRQIRLFGSIAVNHLSNEKTAPGNLGPWLKVCEETGENV